MTTHRALTLAAAVVAAIALGGCKKKPKNPSGPNDPDPMTKPGDQMTPPMTAMDAMRPARPATKPPDKIHHHADTDPFKGVALVGAKINPTKGSKVRGVIWFSKAPEGGVLVEAALSGLGAKTTHGFHIHQYGDCTADDGTSAGGHYNPEGHQHAGPTAPKRHAGDLGNLTSNGKGVAHYRRVLKNVTLAGPKNPVLGRGIIVHKKPDDLKSQPTGAAGPRIGCGVIGVAQGKRWGKLGAPAAGKANPMAAPTKAMKTK